MTRNHLMARQLKGLLTNEKDTKERKMPLWQWQEI